MTNDEISLREYFTKWVEHLEINIAAKWVAHEEVHAMGQRAFDSTVEAFKVKLDEHNKFREQQVLERAEFLRRDVYDRELKALELKIDSHEKWIDNMNGRL